MKNNKQYTGEIGELFTLAFPLILTWLSTTMMMFVDRYFLAQYSLEALGAAVNAGTIAWGFAYGFQIFTEMAQVVVAQYEGAKQHDKVAQPVWQMIWMVVASIVFFIPLGLFGTQLFFVSGSLQGVYFYWLVVFGPAFGLIGACSAYFIGIGESRIVTISAIIGNLVNLVLDWVLIFGIDGIVAPMGIKGAAIATGIGMVVQGLILLAQFLHRTGLVICPLCWKELKSCLRVGVPPGLFIGLELIGWGLFYSMMVRASSEHILVTSICQSLLPLFACVGIGLQKGMAAIGGNLIGADRLQAIPRLMRSGFAILISYMMLLGLLLYIFPEPIMNLFVGYSSDTQEVQMNEIFQGTLKRGLLLSCGYLLFGGLRCLISGILSAAGDTWFLTLAGTLSVWFLLLVPIYYVVLVGQASVTIAQTLMVAYGLSAAIIYWLRFQYGNWSHNCLLIK